MRPKSNVGDDHPGTFFTNCYATICEEINGNLEYSSVNSLESLESYLESRPVKAVRINSDSGPDSEVLTGFSENYAASPYNEAIEAVLYGDEEAVRFGEEVLK